MLFFCQEGFCVCNHVASFHKLVAHVGHTMLAVFPSNESFPDASNSPFCWQLSQPTQHAVLCVHLTDVGDTAWMEKYPRFALKQITSVRIKENTRKIHSAKSSITELYFLRHLFSKDRFSYQDLPNVPQI